MTSNYIDIYIQQQKQKRRKREEKTPKIIHDTMNF